jgi:hypothetical protein
MNNEVIPFVLSQSLQNHQINSGNKMIFTAVKFHFAPTQVQEDAYQVK